MVLTVDTGIQNLHRLDVVTSIILWRLHTQGHIFTPARPVRANTGFMKPQEETVSFETVSHERQSASYCILALPGSVHLDLTILGRLCNGVMQY